MDIDDLVAIQILNDLEDAEDQVENAGGRRNYEKKDPFILPDKQFVSMFRLNKELVRYVITILTPLLINPSRRSALTVQTKVKVHHLLALQY